MKAITLWQPWASLIAWGVKSYETRSWWTPYRGQLAIHAGKGMDTEELFECNSFYTDVLKKHNGGPNGLPSGAVLCIVNLVEVYKTQDIREAISQQEENFGDYSTGRYAWKLEIVEVFKEPVPASGRQGLWEWSR